MESGRESTRNVSPSVPQPYGSDTRIVGRTAELELLDTVVDRLALGTPSFVDITGAAGIGKTRLLTEFCLRARRRGVTVLRGRAAEYERHLPFHPFTDAFAGLGDGPMRDPDLPEVVSRVLAGFDTGPRSTTGDRFGLHRSVARALALLGRGGPLVVALDDVHWADPATVELVDHLVRHPVPSPVALVVARRGRQTSAALSTVLTQALGTEAVLRIGLGPLTEQACTEGLAPGLPREHAARLHAAAEGNPLYFLSLLHAHRGQAAQTAGAVTEANGIDMLLLNEMAPLTPSQRRTLEAVAVLGDHAVPSVMRAATGRNDDELEDDLDVLVRRDLVRTGPGGRPVVRHTVLRTVVHEAVSPRRRARIHHAAAVELARIGASPVEQARHIERSVTAWTPQAHAVLKQAAELTVSTAPTSCAHWLRAALLLLPDSPEHEAERRDLTLRRARALSVSGGLREARSLLHEVIGMSGPGEAGVRTSAVILCARVERFLGHYPEAAALLRREMNSRPAPSDRVAIGLELSSSAPHNAMYPPMRSEVARTLADARTLGDEPGEAGALAVAAFGEAYEGRVTVANEYAKQAAGLMDGLTDGDLAALCEPLGRLGWAEAFLGRYADAERHADRGLRIARTTGQVYVLPLLLLCKAHVRIQVCRLRSARDLADEAEDIARGIGSSELLAFVLANKAQVRIAGSAPGDAEALRTAEEAVTLMGPRTNWRAAMAWCMLGYAALTGGDPHRAREALLRAGGEDLSGLQPSMRPLFSELLVTASLFVGDPASASRWAGRAHEEAERLGLPVQRASAMRSAAQLALHDGDPTRAASLLTEAAAVCGRAGATFWEARSLLLAAQATAATGREARASALWDQGHRLAAAGDAALLVGLAELTRPPSPDAVGTVSWSANLTPREREIAGLVAEGLTNQAIASRLYLSHRTVETHVSRVFRKAGVATRTALAALMARPVQPAGEPTYPNP
ncbi:helix-turn-helix transcriptional regulator [Streptomyces sp. NBC_01423]|uniref:helix-turn-helix transcriptional regulator n=1 Tax=Streptomyces sp. NBC_01423 TaxID=2903860 RepID=UPI002E2E7715|nr:AAA family ATPase [Streptomyces sp. NBC_01423]